MGTYPARLQERLEARPTPVRGIEREVRLAARLQRPHVAHTPTEVGTTLGTPAYMVPEQVTGHPARDHGADVHALGATACELLRRRNHPLSATHAKRTLAPRNTGRSTRDVVIPPPTGGRFK